MNILVITRSSWSNENNIGNTMTNIFKDFPDECNFYNLYFRTEYPNNDISKSAYQINEISLIMSILKKRSKGKEITKDKFINANLINELESEKLVYSNAKKYNLMLFWFARELVWILGNWKKSGLSDYINKISPDIIFMPVFNCFYPHKILKFIRKLTNAKIVLYHADDNYTLKQFSLSPMYWIYRFRLRKWVRNSVNISDVNYVISDIQKREFKRSFKKEFKILTKGADFSKIQPKKEYLNSPIRLVYTGNITSGRWKSLAAIGRALNELNKESIKAQLYIYSMNSMSKKISNALNYPNSVFFMGGVSADRIPGIQNEADILVHVESMKLKERLLVRQSFSTKIVDYFSAARCIFAVGSNDVASIDYLKNNDAAIVSTSVKEIEGKLNLLISNPVLINTYSQKAWVCGSQSHQIKNITEKLLNDFYHLAEEKRENENSTN